jgi:hypothetical protein
MKWIYFLEQKSKLFYFSSVHSLCVKRSGHQLESLRTDRDGAFCHPVTSARKKKRRQLNSTQSAQQNGTAGQEKPKHFFDKSVYYIKKKSVKRL